MNEHNALIQKASSAVKLARARLLDQRVDSVRWNHFIDLSAFTNALYVLMLRTTGLIEAPGYTQIEAELITDAATRNNPDGGFYKYPGSPSHKNTTRIVIISLRLVLGEIDAAGRPKHWFQANPLLNEEQRKKIRTAIEHAQSFLCKSQSQSNSAFQDDMDHLGKLLPSYADPRIQMPVMAIPTPRLQTWLCKPGISRFYGQLHIASRTTLPAVSILYEYTRKRRYGSKVDVYGIGRTTTVKKLIRIILGMQNDDGNWFYNTGITMLNIMALHEAGLPLNHASLRKSADYICRNMESIKGAGLRISLFGSDLCATCISIDAYLKNRNTRSIDDAIRGSIEFILKWQASDGSFCYASGAQKNPDNDSTACALTVLHHAKQLASGTMSDRIEKALQSGLKYLIKMQNRDGGFSTFNMCFIKCKPGKQSLRSQYLWDISTADITARALHTLAGLGLTVSDKRVRRAMRFLLRTQCPNGSWWSRWWAGYIPSAFHALKTYGSLGFRWESPPSTRDRLLLRSHDAMMRAVSFLKQHQNADGGWGETIRADTDTGYAGVSASTPVYTAIAVSGLLACGMPSTRPEIERGISFLLKAMTLDGIWPDEGAIYTIIAGANYYPSPLYSVVFPMNALNDYLESCQGNRT
ncbi:MAG: prenyltransferase/squalene oxidase repeat-containing protein [bacterium]